jgi:probable rRNA maturation factor
MLTTAWSRDAARWFASPMGASSAKIQERPTRRHLTLTVRQAVTMCLNMAPPARTAAPAPDTATLVDISIVSDAEIHASNARYRGKDRPTDVISYAFDDESEGCDGPNFGAMFPGAPHALGEISISIETAERQALERGHGLTEEIAFLAVHGTLHLLGYDHDTPARRRVMWAQQSRVMAALAPRLS